MRQQQFILSRLFRMSAPKNKVFHKSVAPKKSIHVTPRASSLYKEGHATPNALVLPRHGRDLRVYKADSRVKDGFLWHCRPTGPLTSGRKLVCTCEQAHINNLLIVTEYD